jgi:protein-tyrosine phosphatase
MSLIIPHLFLGNVEDAMNVVSSDNPLHITRMVTVSKELSTYIRPPDCVQHLIIEVNDSVDENIHKYFFQAIDFIDEGLHVNENTLVHCYAGISRSSTIIIAYMLHAYPVMTLDDALHHVRIVRPIVNPNPGFLLQLIQHEQERDEFMRQPQL